jgi:glycerophosphoryl diester phosphodiesterase
MKISELKNLIKKLHKEEHRPLCFYHRALSGLNGSNATQELKNILKKKNVDGIEIDVQSTKDGKIIVRHDFALLINGKSEWIKELRLKDIRKVLSDIECITFEKFLKLIGKPNVLIDIEIKNLGIAKEVIKLCYKYNVYSKVVFTTLYEDIYDEIQALDPQVVCMFGYPRDKGKNLSSAKWAQPLIKVAVAWIRWNIVPITQKISGRIDTEFLSYYHKVVTPELVTFIHKQKKICAGATVNLRDDTLEQKSLFAMVSMLKAKVDILKTDYPHLFGQALELSRR